MNFIKSNLAKKIIIILITLMIFNIAVPKTVKAMDLGGILFKPVAQLLLTVIVSIDTTLGIFLSSTSIALTGYGEIMNALVTSMEQQDFRDYETTDSMLQFLEKTTLNNFLAADALAEAGADIATSLAEKTLIDIFIGPDTIFLGKLEMLDANIFRQRTINFGNMSNMFQDSNLIGTIKIGIATTYVLLRNIAAIVMLGGLIFSGIRILVSSNIPTQKQEWLRILQDWIIGMALLIFSHVIMVMIFWISDLFTQELGEALFGFGGLNFQLMLQSLISFDFAEQIITLAMLGYLTYLAAVFAVAYFKRLLWICILIVIAPITSTMYAFGRQGKSIYSRWLKEYAMTVLVQPYHIVIYTVLISIPLNMVNSTGSVFSLADPGSTLTAIYALIAMSMIRPAEKWIRELFGMHTGVASMASFDSGKQTLDAVAKAVSDVAKKVVTTVVAIKTGGASAMLSKGAGAMLSKGAGEAVSKLGAKAGAKAGKGKSVGDMAGKVLGDGPGAGPGNGADIDIAPPKGNGENVPKEQEGGAPQSGDRMQQGAESVSAQLGENGMGGNSQITASNVQLNAGTVDMKSSNVEDKGQTSSQKDESHDSDEKNSTKKGESSDGGEEGKNKIGNYLENLKEGRDMTDEELAEFLEFDSLEDMLKSAEEFSDDEITEYLNKGESESKEKDNGEGFELKEAPASFWEEFKRMKDIYSAAGVDTELMGLGNELYKGVNSVRDTFYVSSAPQDWKNTSGLIDDRKKQIEEKNKKKTDEKESAFIKDEGNKQFMFDNLKLELNGKKVSVMDYYRDVYKGKSEGYIEEKANDRVERELEKMKGYAKYGMNAVQAYPIYQSQKKNGYTTEQAIVEYAGYQELNTDKENVDYVADWLGKESGKYNSVSEILERKDPVLDKYGKPTYDKDGKPITVTINNAEYYYHKGYKDVKDLVIVDKLQQDFKVTRDRAVELDRALRRTGTELKDKGKLDGETDADHQARIKMYEEYNKGYKKIREQRG